MPSIRVWLPPKKEPKNYKPLISLGTLIKPLADHLDLRNAYSFFFQNYHLTAKNCQKGSKAVGILPYNASIFLTDKMTNLIFQLMKVRIVTFSSRKLRKQTFIDYFRMPTLSYTFIKNAKTGPNATEGGNSIQGIIANETALLKT